MAKARSRQQSRFSFDGGLLVLLALSSFSSIYTLRKFSHYQKQVDETMQSNLKILRDEHKRSLDDLRNLVNSGVLQKPVLSSPSTNSFPVLRGFDSASSSSSVFRSLPSGLSIIQCGDWYVTDGIWKYGVGDMSPVGLITNITRGVVFSDIDTFSFCNSPVRPVASAKSEGGKFL